MSARLELEDAVQHEATAYRALLAGNPAHAELIAARDAYLRSHAHVRAESWGRLLGALKMAILARDGVEPVARRAIVETAEAQTPAAAYLAALARTSLGETPHTEVLGQAGGTFGTAAAALDALASGDTAAYSAAVRVMLADFEARESFLTGVRFADTVAVLETLADARGMAVHPVSDILPPPLGL